MAMHVQVPGLVKDGFSFAVSFGGSKAKSSGYEDVEGSVDTGRDYSAGTAYGADEDGGDDIGSGGGGDDFGGARE